MAVAESFPPIAPLIALPAEAPAERERRLSDVHRGLLAEARADRDESLAAATRLKHDYDRLAAQLARLR